jgi:hypothetical protein
MISKPIEPVSDFLRHSRDRQLSTVANLQSKSKHFRGRKCCGKSQQSAIWVPGARPQDSEFSDLPVESFFKKPNLGSQTFYAQNSLFSADFKLNAIFTIPPLFVIKFWRSLAAV